MFKRIAKDKKVKGVVLESTVDLYKYYMVNGEYCHQYISDDINIDFYDPKYLNETPKQRRRRVEILLREKFPNLPPVIWVDKELYEQYFE